MKRTIYGVLFLVLLFVEVWIAVYVHDDFIRPYVGDMLVVFVVYYFVRILVGSVFDVKDIMCYALGCLILGGYELLRYVCRPAGNVK